MRKSKVVALILVIVMIGGAITVGGAEKEDEATKLKVKLSLRMAKLMEDAGTSFDAFANDEITLQELTEEFRNYNGRATFIYINSFKTGDQEFIKLSAGLSLTMDVYLAGLEEGNIEKIKLANSMLEYALIPQFEEIDIGE